MYAVRAANTKISFLSEEVGPYNVEAMREFHQRADIIGKLISYSEKLFHFLETDEVVEVNIMGVFVSQAVGKREDARRQAEEAAFFKRHLWIKWTRQMQILKSAEIDT